jgi:hypothetical protein
MATLGAVASELGFVKFCPVFRVGAGIVKFGVEGLCLGIGERGYDEPGIEMQWDRFDAGDIATLASPWCSAMTDSAMRVLGILKPLQW